MKSPASEVTRLLAEVGGPGRGSAERLFPLVLEELRNLAGHYLADERRDHTLQATALVNEAFLRLAGSGDLNPESRSHFFRVAARAMRRILIDHARARRAAKRGGGSRPERLVSELVDPASGRDESLLELDTELARLEERDPRLAQVVELRFFAGMGNQEIARALGVSVATVERDWAGAKAFLHRRVRPPQ